MNHCIAYLMVAGLALAASPRPVATVSPVGHPAGPVDILIEGSPQPRYAQRGPN